MENQTKQKQNGINVLSLFDGISVAQLSLSQMGIPIKNYYASEIDEKAISVTRHHFPSTIQLGDVRSIDTTKLPQIDLLIFGSPCQDMSSINKNRKGLIGEKSSLFHDAARILNEVKPKYFLMENVASMNKTDRDEISEILGIEPIKINSSLLTAQLRSRYYWTNIPNVVQPKDRKISFQSILLKGTAMKQKAHCVTTRQLQNTRTGLERYSNKSIGNLVFVSAELAYNIFENKFDAFDRITKNGTIKENYKQIFRLPEIVELERLQGLPDNYIGSILKKTSAIHAIGNSFTLPVIKHILSFANFE